MVAPLAKIHRGSRVKLLNSPPFGSERFELIADTNDDAYDYRFTTDGVLLYVRVQDRNTQGVVWAFFEKRSA